ncbi:MAG: ABC transporter ATP-binding protein [Promethearchaeota archaeon]|nr:MAG: ABC transporter ATP-binding protein [Candidatus Lokiarchaeota archaeon]
MGIIRSFNLSKQFGFFYAIKDFTFEIDESSTFGVIGPNGAGKTTLIKLLSGLLSPTHGKIIIDGMNYIDHPKNIKQNIGVITDRSFLYEDLTIYENLKFYSNLYKNSKKSQIREKIEKFLEHFNLQDWIFEPIQNLSKGMKQKVEIIRVLMHNPPILILDEPFSSIDRKTIPLIIKLFVEIQNREKKTIVFSTHNIELAQQLCDEILIINKGNIKQILGKNDMSIEKIKAYM